MDTKTDLKTEEITEEADIQEALPQEKTLEENLKETQGEVTTLKDQLLRAMAETENLRKRFQKEKEDLSRYSVSNFARDLLNVADNLRRALESFDQKESSEKNLSSFIAGIEVTEKELFAIFQRQGIEKIHPNPGDKFDPHAHQAMMEVPSSQDQGPGVVAAVFQSGYRLHERLLRPAMVSVTK